jgi:hypothetical protein
MARREANQESETMAEANKTVANLEDYLLGKPLSDRMARLMRGDDEEETGEEAAPRRENYADGTPITDQDRDHLRRMLTSAGWQVLVKLLDTSLQRQEDAARQDSLRSPLSRKDEIATQWADLAANKKARNEIVILAEGEIEKLKAAKAKKKSCATGTTKTPTGTN